MPDTNIPTPDQADEDDYIRCEMDEFYEEQGREPYSSHEFARWLTKRQVSCANQIQAQLELKGLEVTADGRIVPKRGAR